MYKTIHKCLNESALWQTSRRLKTRCVCHPLHVLRPSFEIRFPSTCSWSTATNVKEIYMITGWECIRAQDTWCVSCWNGPCHGKTNEPGRTILSSLLLSPFSTIIVIKNAHQRCCDLTNGDRRATWEELRLWNETSLGLNLIPVTSYL